MSNFIKKLYNKSVLPSSIRGNDEVMSLWMGRSLSFIELMSINSYFHHGHKVIVYIYEDIENMPKDVELRDANEILPYNNFKRTEVYRDEKFVGLGIPENNRDTLCYSMYSDLFRYTLGYKLGGWWTDLDAICLKHFDFDEQYVFAFLKDDNHTVAPGIFKVPPKTNLMEACVVCCKLFMDNRINSDRTGPYLFSRTVRANSLLNITFPHYYFYPFSFEEMGVLFDGTPLPSESYSVHIFNTRFGIKYGRDEKNDGDCMISKLKEMYL